MKTIFKTALLAALLVSATTPALSQVDTALPQAQLRVLNPVPAVKKMQLARQAKLAVQTLTAEGAVSSVPTPALKIFPYSVTSPRDGRTYTGTIVGADPRNNGARTTNVQVVLIPLRIQFTGLVRSMDPTSPDAGCLGNTPLQLTQASPLFKPVSNYMINGVNMGNTTFIDAFQRAQFWQDAIGGPVVSAKPAYHLGLPVTLAAKQTISLPNEASATSPGFSVSIDSDTCSTNVAGSQDNPSLWAAIDINYMDVKLNAIIASLHLTPDQFPLFLTYRTVMTDGPPGAGGNCCILGYHGSSNPVPSNPGQTYGIANFDQGTVFSGTNDVSVLSHEILEWINDPSGNNQVPAWGKIGQVSGCQNNLETGDPLSGTPMPGVVMPNGITYHPQENAFFSWFLGTGFTGAGGKYSSNGSFGGFARSCAAGGGTF